MNSSLFKFILTIILTRSHIYDHYFRYKTGTVQCRVCCPAVQRFQVQRQASTYPRSHLESLVFYLSKSIFYMSWDWLYIVHNPTRFRASFDCCTYFYLGNMYCNYTFSINRQPKLCWLWHHSETSWAPVLINKSVLESQNHLVQICQVQSGP